MRVCARDAWRATNGAALPGRTVAVHPKKNLNKKSPTVTWGLMAGPHLSRLDGVAISERHVEPGRTVAPEMASGRVRMIKSDD